jgi:hypothetical protein
MFKKLRTMGRQKNLERVVHQGKYEVMTSTQAVRFEELHSIHRNPPEEKPQKPALKPLYSLTVGSKRLGVSVDDVLAAAIDGRIRCYVKATSLRGKWRDNSQASAEAGKVPKPAFFAIPIPNCREIRDFGSANVNSLEHIPGTGEAQEFCLQETQWIDQERIVLLHPLRRFGA